MRERFNRLLHLRFPLVRFAFLLSLALIFLLPFPARAQELSFSLDDIQDLRSEVPWDTLHVGDISSLPLGVRYKVPNFLEHDFSRVRVQREYSDEGRVRVTFSWPRIYTFDFNEKQEGAFTVFEPRNLDTPGLEISIETVDQIAERIRHRTFKEEWRQGVIGTLQGQQIGVKAQHGLIHVTIPLPLPKTVERIIGRGDATNIDISGRESITFAGESRRVSPFIGVEGQKKQPLFPSLDMKQELDVRLQGTIGEKINVQVDHTSSSSLTENQNRIRLNYKGFEDDVVQLIELGNTNLSLPGSQLVSFSTASKGLFGIKALAQVGPMDLTVIASKQEGEVSQATYTPQGAAFGQVETKTIRDIDYIKNRFFYLDRPQAGVFFAPQEGNIEVFESVYDWERNANPEMVTFLGRAWVDSAGRGDDIRSAQALVAQGQEPPPYQERYFKLLTLGEDYRFVQDAADLTSIIGLEMIRSVNPDKILAVRYVNELGDTVGNYDDFISTLALEMIKPANPLPTDEFGYTWAFMMRHIYNLGLSNIDASSLDIQIEDNTNRIDRTSPDGSTEPYLRIFGLDRTDESGIGDPDNRIDTDPGIIDLERGILTFPTLRPFDPPPDSVTAWTNGTFSFTGDYTELLNAAIYDDYLTIPDEYNKFKIIVRASSTTKTFFIDAFNIIEGSEVVTLDGRKLARNRDYTIDYNIGEVELRGDVLDQITPTSRINIDYEYTPFAGGASSSLLGFNSLLHLAKNGRVGTTWLYESKSSASDRPRLGEEPSRTVLGDVDGYLQFDSDKLTSLVNVLPLVDTDAKSTVTLSGEIAMSFPNPNTHGEVYIDDMEGVEDSDVFPVGRRSWVWASPPVDPTAPADNFVLDHTKRDNFFWYNIEPELGVHRRDLNPLLDEQENSLVQSIDIEVDTVAVDSTYWAGIMTGFPGGGLDLSQGQFIEIWINDFKPDAADRSGKLYIELGSIDENFFEPGINRWNKEDANRDGFTALTEDTGLDLLFDEEESGSGSDPAGDNYSPTRVNNKLTKINGTERNGLEDDEDLDNSGQMERENTYFRFEVALTDSAIIDIQRDFPGQVPDPSDSWRLYRISLAGARVVSPTGAVPRWERIKHLRVWFDNIGATLNQSKRRLQFAGFKVVGNRWEEDGIRDHSGMIIPPAAVGDTDFSLGVISTKTDPIAYTPPFIPGEQENIALKEQSLLIDYENLGPDTQFRIKKRFTGNGLDFTQYSDLNFWVNTKVMEDSLEYFFRVAFDSLNYYEITVPFRSEYFNGAGWAIVSVSLTDLSALKFAPEDSAVYGTAPDITTAGREYPITMVGLPNLFTVRFLYAGLRNRSTNTVYDGEVWLDDIYLGGVNRDIDFAQRLSASMSLGNVINFNAGWRRTGPDFHGLNQKRGSGTLNNSLNLSGRTNLEHFLPLFGFSIPVSGNYSKSSSKPKFRPQSDTEISDPVLQDSLRTESIARGFSTTLSKSGSKNPLFKYTFDKIRANFAMSQSRSVSPASRDTTLNMSGTFDYQMNWSRQKHLRIFKNYKLRYWLNNVSFRMQAQRRTGTRYRYTSGKFVKDPPLYSAGIQSDGSASYAPFPSLTTSFKMSLKRDLRLPHEWLGVDIGMETNRNQQVQASYKPPPIWLIGAFSPDFNYVATYNEDSSPNVRRSGDPRGVRNVSSGRTASVKMRFDVGGMFGRVFRTLRLNEKQENPSRSSRGRGSGRPPPATAGADTAAAGAAPDSVETGGGGPDPLVAVRKVTGILSRIRKVNASIQQRTQSNYNRIPYRPALEYQLGFTPESGVTSGGILYDTPERFTKALVIGLDSGTELTKNIDLAGRYSTSFSTSNFRDNETESRNTTWPDFNVSWKGLEQLGIFGGMFQTSSATFSYKRTTQKSGRVGTTDSENSTSQMSPTFVAKWKNGLNSTLTFARNKRINDTRGSKTELTGITVAMDLKYSFRPGKGLGIPLPFLSNKLNLKSNLDTSLNIAYSRNSGQRYSSLSPEPEDLPGTNSLRVSPRMTYNFSRTLNGSFFVDYSRSYSEASNQTTTLIRMGITAIFTF